MNHLKLVVVGPKECGKSYICNFLSESIDQVTGGYHPTTGVRILEYEQKINVKGKTSKIDVELWDTSGDNRFETCWPAVFKGSHGVVFVYNPDNSNHEEDLNKWYQAIPFYSDLSEQQMCVICHKKPNTPTLDICSLPHEFQKVLYLSSNIPKDGEKFREKFGKFVSQLARSRLEANELEELKIVNC